MVTVRKFKSAILTLQAALSAALRPGASRPTEGLGLCFGYEPDSELGWRPQPTRLRLSPFTSVCGFRN